VDADAICALVDDQTAMVSVTHAAGEMGTVQPIAEIAKKVKHLQKACRIHTDAVQALPQLGRLALCPEIDMVTVSSHKILGPQGIGALLLRPNSLPRPLLFGGDQQQGIRPGTLNLPGIVGFGEAARIFAAERDEGVVRMRALCDRLIQEIVSTVGGAALLGNPAARAPGLAVIAFDNVESEVLLHTLEKRGVLASSSSACHSTRKDPPRCLIHAGLRHDQGAVRFSLSTKTTTEDIDGAVAVVSQAVAAFRSGRIGDV
jgi:cysteine desulfurase